MLGARTEPFDLGPPGHWLADAPDVRSALAGFQQLQGTNSRGAVFYLRRAKPDFILGYGVYDGTATAHAQAYALAMAAAFSVLRRVTGGVAEPSEVLFSFRRPKDVAPYIALFGVPVQFDQYETGLVFTPAAMQAPVLGSKSANLDFWRKKALEIAPQTDRPWTDNVRHALRPLLLDDKASAPAVAETLKIDVRTLGRRLEAEGTAFQRVSDEVRYAIARELLEVTDLRIGDIATALSYATHGAFVVAFQRWAGVSPTQWRKARRESR
jgi:AraC-like DNA-binding protein